jgi:hypothetical protein
MMLRQFPPAGSQYGELDQLEYHRKRSILVLKYSWFRSDEAGMRRLNECLPPTLAIGETAGASCIFGIQ